MSFLIAAPDVMAAAASDLANIGSTIGSANVAAAAVTTGILPAGADEVSAGIVAMFSAHAAGYQQLSAAAEEFHQQFVEALNAGAAAYAAAETEVVQTLANAVPALGADVGGGLASAGLPAVPGAWGAGLPGVAAGLGGGLPSLGAELNATLSGGLGISLSGLGPIGGTLAANVNGAAAAVVPTGAALPALSAAFSAGMPGLMANLSAAFPALSTGVAGVANTIGLNPGLAACAIDGLTGMGGEVTGFLTVGLGAGVAGVPGLLANFAAPWQALSAAWACSPTAFLHQLQTMELCFNSAVLHNEFCFNGALTANEMGIESAIFGNTGNGVMNSFYNFWNSVLGGGETSFNGLLGVQTPCPGALTQSLFVGTSPCIEGGALGGLLDAVPTKFLWDLDVIGGVYGGLTVNGALPTGLVGALTGAISASGTPLGGLLAAIPTTPAALIASPVAGLQGIGAVELGSFDKLITTETAFNNNLLNSELSWEASTFGPNAFNGALDRVFNVGNLCVATGEQTGNGLLGGRVAPGLFLTGGPECSYAGYRPGLVFDHGDIGGIEGIFDQTLAAGFDLAGLT